MFLIDTSGVSERGRIECRNAFCPLVPTPTTWLAGTAWAEKPSVYIADPSVVGYVLLCTSIRHTVMCLVRGQRSRLCISSQTHQPYPMYYMSIDTTYCCVFSSWAEKPSVYTADPSVVVYVLLCTSIRHTVVCLVRWQRSRLCISQTQHSYPM